MPSTILETVRKIIVKANMNTVNTDLTKPL